MFVIEICLLLGTTFLLSNKLEVFSFGDGLIEINGELVERQPNDNENYIFPIKKNFIGTPFLLSQKPKFRSIFPLLLQSLKGPTKEA